MQICNSAALVATIMFFFKKQKTDFMFPRVVAVKVELSMSLFSLSKLRYKKKINDTNSSHVKTIEL